MGNNKNKERHLGVKWGGIIEKANAIEWQWHCWTWIREAQEIAH